MVAVVVVVLVLGESFFLFLFSYSSSPSSSSPPPSSSSSSSLLSNNKQTNTLIGTNMFRSKKISSSSSSSRNRNGGRNCCNNQNDGDGDDDDREAGVRMVMVKVVKNLDDKAEKNTAELPTVDVKSSNWKGTVISILVILFLCSVITFAIYIINPDIQNKLTRNLNKEKLKLSDWLNNKYSPGSTYNGTWISDTELAFINAEGSFVRYDVRQNETRIIVDAGVMKPHDVSRAILSPNGNYVLLISHVKGVFRHSTLAHYKIFNISTTELITVKPAEAKEDSYLQAAQWAPVGASLVFVYENNLYYLPGGSGGLRTPRRLTHSADRYLYNGIPDWIYEEEILATQTAFWWLADGSRLVYAQFDDTAVELQEYPWYGDVVDSSSQYLDRVKIKYPKPGRTNPTVKLFVVSLTDLENGGEAVSSSPVSPPANLTESDYYLTSVAWFDSSSFIAVWFNRVQNYSTYSLCSPQGAGTSGGNWSCEDNHVYSVSDGWIEIGKVYVGPDGEHYYTLLPDETRERNVQIVKINRKSLQTEYVTSGRKDVTDILRILPSGSDRTTIHYMATREGAPGQRHYYSVEVATSRKSFFGSNKQQHQQAKPPAYSGWPKEGMGRNSAGSSSSSSSVSFSEQCHTCDQLELKQCLYNRVQLSRAASYYVHECLGPGIPYSTLVERESEADQTSTSRRPWLNNDQLAASLATKLMPTVRTEVFNTTEGYSLIVQMFMPPSFDENQIVKYPLLIQVYGGPGSQNVNENFKMNFGKYLASAKDIIYAYVDGRGSGYQGEALKYQLYHKLGSAEIEDQILAAKYLRETHKWINKDAIGIWGWSYGGYATAMILAKDTDDPVFSCGISVAPVTSWLLYDSAYTERYMGLPEKNQQSYFKSDVMHLANNFKGKKYLLIHGTADDNVHVQNSMALIKALNHANVMFQTQIYPDENHALPGVSLHLYTKMEAFWSECFQMDSYVEEIGLRRRRIIKHGSV